MRLCAIIMVVAGLLLGYPLSLVLPTELSWENGWLENIQLLVLLVGLLFSVYACCSESDKRVASLWLVTLPMWLILFAREASWGAIFFDPLVRDPITGPGFSSSAQVPWKPWVTPVLVIVILFSIGLFVRKKLHKVWLEQWRKSAFPLRELSLCLLAFLLSNEADGHGLFEFSHLGDGELQLLEEWSEMWAYIALLMAQWQFFSRLKTAHA